MLHQRNNAFNATVICQQEVSHRPAMFESMFQVFLHLLITNLFILWVSESQLFLFFGILCSAKCLFPFIFSTTIYLLWLLRRLIDSSMQNVSKCSTYLNKCICMFGNFQKNLHFIQIISSFIASHSLSFHLYIFQCWCIIASVQCQIFTGFPLYFSNHKKLSYSTAITKGST